METKKDRLVSVAPISPFVLRISSIDSKVKGVGSHVKVICEENPRLGCNEYRIEGDFYFSGLFLPVEVERFHEYLRGKDGEALFDITVTNGITNKCLKCFANCSFVSGDLECENVTTTIKNALFTFKEDDFTYNRYPHTERKTIRENAKKGAIEPNTIKQQLDEAKKGREVVWKPRPINW